MTLSLQEQSLFADAIQAMKVHALPAQHIDAIANGIGVDECVRLARRVLQGDQAAAERVFHLTRVARAFEASRATLRMPYATFGALDQVRQRDPGEFTAIFAAAINDHDQGALASIKGWFNPVASEPARQPTPIHRTTVPPPGVTAETPRTAQPVRAVAATTAEPATQPTRTQPAPSNVRPFRAAEDHTPPAPVQPTIDRQYDQVVVYGRDRQGGTALQIEHSPTKDRKASTINLAIGRAKQQRTQDGVDWANKLSLMLVPHEVTLILAVLLGQAPSCRFAGHGPAHDKWIEVEEVTDEAYQGQVTVTLVQGKGNQADYRRCGIAATDIARAIAIFSRAQMSLLPGTAPIDGHLITRRTADLYAKAKRAEESRQQRRPQAVGGNQR